MITEKQYEEISISRMRHLYDRTLTIPCVVLCVLLFLVFGLLPIIPSRLTALYRPVFIFCTTFSIYRSYPLRSSKWQLVLAVYFAIIFICNHITGTATESFISHELFIIFFVLASGHVWSKREINMVLNVVIFSCTTQAIIILFSNSLLLHSGGQNDINYLWFSTNRNPIAFAIVPGAIASLLLLLYYRKSLGTVLSRVYWVLCFLICFYSVFAIGCRSAFYALCLGVACLIWERVRRSRTPAEKIIQELFILIFILIFVRILVLAASGAYSSRLFTWEESGRELIWQKALEMIKQKPIFGGGYDYWISAGLNIGTHSTFISYMLEGGIITLILLVFYFVSLLFEWKETTSAIPLAFLPETLFHSFTETSMDYYAYIPLILCVILIRYLQYQGNIQDLLSGQS